MYVDPFWFGFIVGFFTCIMALFIYAVWSDKK